MSLANMVTIAEPDFRADKVAEAYAHMKEAASKGQNFLLHNGGESPAVDELQAFQLAIRDEVAYGHQQIANALGNLGYNIDRKQVHNYREKLKLGRVTL